MAPSRATIEGHTGAAWSSSVLDAPRSPPVIAAGLLYKPVSVPWWNGLPLRLTV